MLRFASVRLLDILLFSILERENLWQRSFKLEMYRIRFHYLYAIIYRKCQQESSEFRCQYHQLASPISNWLPQLTNISLIIYLMILCMFQIDASITSTLFVQCSILTQTQFRVFILNNKISVTKIATRRKYLKEFFLSKWSLID